VSRIMSISNYSWWLLIAAFAILITATASSGSPEFRSESIDEGLIWSSRHVANENWTIKGQRENVTLNESGLSVSLSKRGHIRANTQVPIRLPENVLHKAQYLRINGTVTRESAFGYIYEQNRQPRLEVRFLDAAGKVLQQTRERQNGLAREYRISKLMAYDRDMDVVTISWRIRSQGSWRLDDLTIQAVGVSDRYVIAKYILMVCTILLFLCLGGMTLRRLSLNQFCTVFFILLGTIYLTSVNSSGFSELMSSLERLLRFGLPQGFLPESDPLRKIGHYLAFLLFTTSLVFYKRQLNILTSQILMISLCLAAFTESLQIHQLTRSAALSDVAIDMAGTITAIVVTHHILKRRKKCSKNEHNRLKCL
jgi:VanZ family protein